MRIRKVEDNKMIIETYEKQWMLVVLVSGITIFAILLYKTGINIVGIVIFILAFLTWCGFAYFAANTKIVIDKVTQIFSYNRCGFLKENERFRCELKDIEDVVLDSTDAGADTSYRIVFIANNNTLYLSQIFSGGAFSSIEKHYHEVRSFIF